MDKKQKQKKKQKDYGTQYSRVVPHHSTDWADTSLTSEIGRDPVLSSTYGRRHQFSAHYLVINGPQRESGLTATRVAKKTRMRVGHHHAHIFYTNTQKYGRLHGFTTNAVSHMSTRASYVAGMSPTMGVARRGRTREGARTRGGPSWMKRCR